MTRLKNAKAFTLIELIVVIVIIGILVAIAAVAYNAIIDNAKKSGAETSAAQVAKVIAGESAASQVAVNTDANMIAAAAKESGSVAQVADAAAAKAATDGKIHVYDGTAADGKIFVEKGGWAIEVTKNDAVGQAPTYAKGTAVKL